MTKHPPRNPAKQKQPRPSPAARYAAFQPVCDCGGTGRCPNTAANKYNHVGCTVCDSTGLCLKCQVAVEVS